jgi:hypothetical protein
MKKQIAISIAHDASIEKNMMMRFCQFVMRNSTKNALEDFIYRFYPTICNLFALLTFSREKRIKIGIIQKINNF